MESVGHASHISTYRALSMEAGMQVYYTLGCWGQNVGSNMSDQED